MTRVQHATDGERAYYRCYSVVWWKGEWEFRREFPSRVMAEDFRRRLSGRREVAASVSAVCR